MAVSVANILVRSQKPFSNFIRSCSFMQTRSFSLQDKKHLQPKRPATQYAQFISDNYTQLKSSNPSLKSSEIMKLCSTEWKKLPDTKKMEYKHKAENLMEKYVKEKHEFMMSLTTSELEELKAMEDDKKKKRATIKKKLLYNKLGKPKGRTTAFGEYFKEMMPQREGVPVADYMRSVGLVWRRMPEEDKEKYNAISTKKNKLYHTALEQWEDRMLRQGHTEVVRRASRPKPPHQKRKRVVASKKKVATRKIIARPKSKKLRATKKVSSKTVTKKTAAKSSKDATKEKKISKAKVDEDVSWMREE